MMNKIYKFQLIGNKKRSYRQSKFIFSTFNLTGNSRVEMEPAMVDKAVQKMKKLGLNLIETAHSAMNTAMYALEVCEREGIDVIWQNYYLFGGFHDMFRRPTTFGMNPGKKQTSVPVLNKPTGSTSTLPESTPSLS